MTAPKPVVTMDEDCYVSLDDVVAGEADGDKFWPARPTFTAAELRAIADFLDQLAGANLLSEVVEG